MLRPMTALVAVMTSYAQALEAWSVAREIHVLMRALKAPKEVAVELTARGKS